MPTNSFALAETGVITSSMESVIAKIALRTDFTVVSPKAWILPKLDSKEWDGHGQPQCCHRLPMSYRVNRKGTGRLDFPAGRDAFTECRRFP